MNGSALVYTDAVLANTYVLLGFTDGGVDMNVQYNRGEIMTDIMGPMTPQDFQDFGMTARIVCPFIAIDRTQMTSVLKRGDAASVGLNNTPGIVVGAGTGPSGPSTTYKFKLGIASPFDTGWLFSACLVRPGFGTKLAVKANPYRVEFFAWPYASYTVTTGKDASLYTRGSPA